MKYSKKNTYLNSVKFEAKVFCVDGAYLSFVFVSNLKSCDNKIGFVIVA